MYEIRINLLRCYFLIFSLFPHIYAVDGIFVPAEVRLTCPELLTKMLAIRTKKKPRSTQLFNFMMNDNFENIIFDSEKYLFENFTLNIVYTFISILLVSIGWSIHLRTKIKKKKILRIFIFYLMGALILFSNYNFKIN